jgi:hypothetical protein
MKKLTARQAQNCEEALGPVCRCRCGGALHGAKRKGYEQGREFYENLPEDDPHIIKKKKSDETPEDAPTQLRLKI